MRVNILHFFQFFAILVISEAFFRSKIDRLKDKAKDIYRKTMKKDKTWHFLGKDPSLYPGTDAKYRQENQEKWDEYYKCLKAQEAAIGAHGSFTPEAVLGYEGGTISFECKLCLSPIVQEDIEEVQWYHGEINKKYLEIILLNEHVMISPGEKKLNLFNLKEHNSGQYVCILGDSVTVPYYLTVVNGTTKISEVHTDKAKYGPHSRGEQTFTEHLLTSTEWGPWSGCSKCDKTGRRHKFGSCEVGYYSPVKKREIRHGNSTENRNITSTTRKPKKTKPTTTEKTGFFEHLFKKNVTETPNVTDVSLELIKVFMKGIPCRSHILPEDIKSLTAVKERRDEVMLGYCKVKCKNNKIFQVKDKNGKVIETVNNSAGIYSTVQGVPPVAPSVERMLQYEKRGVNVVLICPGNLNSDTPIQWQAHSKNIIPDIMFKESKGRIYVSLLDRIHIKKAKVSDSTLYSCWQNDELAGTVRLIVGKKIQLSFNHHIMLFGVMSILATFLFIFVKAFAGRKFAKAARQ